MIAVGYKICCCYANPVVTATFKLKQVIDVSGLRETDEQVEEAVNGADNDPDAKDRSVEWEVTVYLCKVHCGIHGYSVPRWHYIEELEGYRDRYQSDQQYIITHNRNIG